MENEKLCPCGNDAEYPEDAPRMCQDCYEAYLEDLELQVYMDRDLC